MPSCPCQSTIDFLACCAPYLDGTAIPQTPEALMRSRYTAYSLAAIDYIKMTMKGKPLIGFNEHDIAVWASSVVWVGLKILATQLDAEDQGKVEFVARYIESDKLKSIHELSEFRRFDGRWYYVDGVHPMKSEFANVSISRNAPCPCGSNKKYKNCDHNRP